MRGRLWVDVTEGQALIVLVDNSRGNLPVDDFQEEIVLQHGIPSPQNSWCPCIDAVWRIPTIVLLDQCSNHDSDDRDSRDQGRLSALAHARWGTSRGRDTGTGTESNTRKDTSCHGLSALTKPATGRTWARWS